MQSVQTGEQDPTSSKNQYSEKCVLEGKHRVGQCPCPAYWLPRTWHDATGWSVARATLILFEPQQLACASSRGHLANIRSMSIGVGGGRRKGGNKQHGFIEGTWWVSDAPWRTGLLNPLSRRGMNLQQQEPLESVVFLFYPLLPFLLLSCLYSFLFPWGSLPPPPG